MWANITLPSISCTNCFSTFAIWSRFKPVLLKLFQVTAAVMVPHLLTGILASILRQHPGGGGVWHNGLDIVSTKPPTNQDVATWTRHPGPAFHLPCITNHPVILPSLLLSFYINSSPHHFTIKGYHVRARTIVVPHPTNRWAFLTTDKFAARNYDQQLSPLALFSVWEGTSSNFPKDVAFSKQPSFSITMGPRTGPQQEQPPSGSYND